MPSASERKSWSLTEHGFVLPSTARVLEVANQLLLLGIDTDNGQVVFAEVLAQSGDFFELLVALFWFGMFELLVIDAQGEALRVEKRGNGSLAYIDAERTELACDARRRSSRPLQTAH